jgi:hypothetical protein
LFQLPPKRNGDSRTGSAFGTAGRKHHHQYHSIQQRCDSGTFDHYLLQSVTSIGRLEHRSIAPAVRVRRIKEFKKACVV